MKKLLLAAVLVTVCGVYWETVLGAGYRAMGLHVISCPLAPGLVTPPS